MAGSASCWLGLVDKMVRVGDKSYGYGNIELV